MNTIKKISFIGAGNVATHLALELKSKGFEISSIFNRTFEGAEKLASRTMAEAVTELKLLHASDLLIIAVPDNAIPEIVKGITSFKGIIAHTSGSTNMEVFDPITSEYGVFYPLQTFSKSRVLNFSEIPICIEASSKETESILLQLARKISYKTYSINSEQRKMLHVSAVFACNFTNFMYTVAHDILEKENISFEIIKPLIAETAEKIKKLNPFEAQTGPALRKDSKTLIKHKEYLSNFPEYKKIYTFISEKIQKHWSSEKD